MKKKLDMKKYFGKESEFVLNLGVMSDFEEETGHSFFKGFDMGKMKLSELLVLIYLGVKAAGYDIKKDEIRNIDINLISDFSEDLGRYFSSGKKDSGSPFPPKK